MRFPLTPGADWAGLPRRAFQAIARHPKTVLATLAVLMAGSATVAFGIAPLAPDAAALPKRQIVEALAFTPPTIDGDALTDASLVLYRSETTRPNDTADTLLARVGVTDLEAADFLRRDPVARRLLSGSVGKRVQFQVGRYGQLEELVARYPCEESARVDTHFSRLTLRRDGGLLHARVETVPMVAQVRLGSGTVRSSLYAATDEADLPDSVASQISEIFATDIDFHHDLRRGDTFTVLYEALMADGEPVTWGAAAAGAHVIGAEFVNDGRTYSAVWFTNAAGKGNYYGFDGKSKHRSFLASPMAFSRVTSGFAMRMHPIMQTWRKHLGVDYGAPTGTAVRTVGDGVVEFAGWQNGYGNIVRIKHDAARMTAYAHLSHIDVRVGQHVEQGQRLGAVGMTGWATGPHLHFEFRVNGVHQDPSLVARSSEVIQVGASDAGYFAQLSGVVKSQLDAAESATRIGAFE